MRECRRCGEYKREDEFPTQRKVGFRGNAGTVTMRLDCRTCVATAAREYRRTHTTVPKVPLPLGVDKYLWSAIGCRIADARARKECDLTKEFMYSLYTSQQGRCALSGIPLNTVKGSPWVLSIDKIDPLGNYTAGNVQWVAWAINRAKGDLTTQDFLSMCAAVLERCNDYPEREYSQVAGSAQHL